MLLPYFLLDLNWKDIKCKQKVPFTQFNFQYFYINSHQIPTSSNYFEVKTGYIISYKNASMAFKNSCLGGKNSGTTMIPSKEKRAPPPAPPLAQPARLWRLRASAHGCSEASEVHTLHRLIHLSGPFPPTVSLSFSLRVLVEETAAFASQRRARRAFADCMRWCHVNVPWTSRNW